MQPLNAPINQPIPIHPLQVAGKFYPSDAQSCWNLVAEHLKKAALHSPKNLKMMIAPHAGLTFSGEIMATAVRNLPNNGTIGRIVLIGPAHRMAFRGIATTSAPVWQTPFGRLRVNKEGIKDLLQKQLIHVDDRPFINEHALETQLPYFHAWLKNFEIIPLLVGDTPALNVARALSEVWGGSETLISVSSDLSHYQTYEQARQSDLKTRHKIESLDLDGLESAQACGHRAIRGALIEAQKRNMRLTCIDLRNSGDTNQTNILRQDDWKKTEKVVGYGAFVGEYAHSAHLADSERELLRKIAKAVIMQAVQNAGSAPQSFQLNKLPAPLLACRASFVTLKIQNQLRGCIGSLIAHRPLMEDVCINAYKAGFSDPRFPPLSVEDIKNLDMEVSILSHPRPIDFSDEQDLIDQLQPDDDGLILEDKSNRGIFLPSVWENLPHPTAFLKGLKRKAGLSEDHWSPFLRVSRFSVEKF